MEWGVKEFAVSLGMLMVAALVLGAATLFNPPHPESAVGCPSYPEFTFVRGTSSTWVIPLHPMTGTQALDYVRVLHSGLCRAAP